MFTQKENKTTVQGFGTPVPAALGSEQAGSQSSKSNDRFVPAVGNLADGTRNITSPFSVKPVSGTPGGFNPFQKSGRLQRSPTRSGMFEAVSIPNIAAAFEKELAGEPVTKVSKLSATNKLISDLADFVKDRNNVHGEIKRMIRMIKLSYNEVEKEFEALTERTERAEASLANNGDRTNQEPGEDLLLSSQVTFPPKSKPMISEILNISLKKDKRLGGTVDIPKDEPSKRRRDSPGQSETQMEAKKRNTKSVLTPGRDNWTLEARPDWQKVKPKKRKRKWRRQPRPDALLIKKNGDVSYADLLRKVKADSQLKGLGEKVTHIRQTAKGDLLLELDSTGDQPQTAIFQAQLQGIIGKEADVRILSQETLIEIRDIDEVTTSEDVLQALESHVKETKGTTTVKTLRASYRGTQMAVISMPRKVAEQVLERGKIRIGWVICRIREAVKPVKCFKCFEFGHLAQKCRSENDRSKLCINCGKEGHIAKQCKNDPKCVLCSEEAVGGNKHATGSWKCPAYKKALDRMLVK